MNLETYFYGIAEHTLNNADFERLSYERIIAHGRQEFELLQTYFGELSPGEILEALNFYNGKQNDF